MHGRRPIHLSSTESIYTESSGDEEIFIEDEDEEELVFSSPSPPPIDDEVLYQSEETIPLSGQSEESLDSDLTEASVEHSKRVKPIVLNINGYALFEVIRNVLLPRMEENGVDRIMNCLNEIVAVNTYPNPTINAVGEYPTPSDYRIPNADGFSIQSAIYSHYVRRRDVRRSVAHLLPEGISDMLSDLEKEVIGALNSAISEQSLNYFDIAFKF